MVAIDDKRLMTDYAISVASQEQSTVVDNEL